MFARNRHAVVNYQQLLPAWGLAQREANFCRAQIVRVLNYFYETVKRFDIEVLTEKEKVTMVIGG